MTPSAEDSGAPSGTDEGRRLRDSDERALGELATEAAEQGPRDEHLRARVSASLFGGPPPQPERVARYRIQGTIGAGAMGEVLEGYDEVLARVVAIKVVHHLRRSPRASARMLREARSLAQLSHPNVVQVYEAGMLGDRAWIAMERVVGRPLSAWLDEPRGVDEILAAFVAAGEGLVAAHEAGLVHRDFKPDNVLVNERGRIKVVDFGLVRPPLGSTWGSSPEAAEAPEDRSEPAHAGLTGDGVRVGTPAYMSPEQILGVAVDARSDQFSWCVAVWEALFGTRPFLGRTLQELHAAMLHGRLVSAGRAKTIPSPVRRVLIRGLSYRPGDRFPTMHELLAALRRRPSRARVATLGLVAVLVGSAVLAGQGESTECGEGIDPSAAWSAERVRAIESTFLGTELPYAASAARSTIDALEAYAADLERARGQVCAHGSALEPEHLQARLGCLRNRVTFLDALAGSLTMADATAVERAVDAVDDLPEIDRCVETAPDDASGALEQPHLRGRLAEAEAAVRTGHAARASERFHGVIESARLEGDVVSEIDGLLGRATARFDLGELGGGRDDLLAAIGRATSAKLDDRAARAWVELATRGGRDLRNVDDTPRWLEQARAWVERTGLRGQHLRLDLAEAHLLVLSDPSRAHERFDDLVERAGDLGEDELVSQSRSGRAAAAMDLGRYDEAEADYRWLLGRRRASYGDGHPKTLSAYHGLGIALDRSGELDAASEAYERALAGWRALHPSGHLEIARVLIALGNADLARGDLRRARARAEEALELQRRLAPDDVGLAEALTLMGVVQHVSGQAQSAARSHEGALRSYEVAFGVDDVHAAIARSNLGEALLMSGRYEDARPLFEHSLRVLETIVGTEHPWLAYPLKGLGIAAVLEGRADEALTRLDRALVLTGADAAERAEIELALEHARNAVEGTLGEVEVPSVADEIVRARLERLSALLGRGPVPARTSSPAPPSQGR